MRGGTKMSFQESGKTPDPNTETDDPTLISSLKLKKRKSKLKSHLSKKRDLKRTNFDQKSAGSKRKINSKTLKKVAPSNFEGENFKLIRCETNQHINEGKKRTRMRKKKKKVKAELGEPARLQRRTRYLMIKMKLEQNLIDAYSAEGWKGQSREKIRPEEELQRAKKQILRCKLGVRDVIRQLDSLSSAGSIEDSVMAPDGSVYHEHIFCAKCKSSEVFMDNDIILCDGACNSAFHQKCHDPPLETENIPPGDQGWFCRFCDCRMEILDALNAHLGTHFTMNNSWEDVFKEEASIPEGGNASLNPDDEWPSDDSEDVDYNPERRENSSGFAGTNNNPSEDECSSASSSSVGSDESSEGEILVGRRQRRDVDYIKLYHEMFGKDALSNEQVSEDEDWGPTKRKRKRKESDVENEKEKNSSDVLNGDVENQLPVNTQIRKSFFRIPQSAVERLREVFAENELPPRDVKENVSKELGLDSEKVSKWFKNARYLALKTRKAEGENRVQAHKDSESPEARNKGGDAIIPQNNPTETVVHTSRNVNKSNQRNQSKSLTTLPTKKPVKWTSLGLPSNSNKESLEIGEDVTLKKLVKERNKEKNQVKFIGGSGCKDDAEAEMERLCKVKDRLDNLNQRVLRFQNEKVTKNTNKSSLHGNSVIYVPVAELREEV